MEEQVLVSDQISASTIYLLFSTDRKAWS